MISCLFFEDKDYLHFLDNDDNKNLYAWDVLLSKPFIMISYFVDLGMMTTSRHILNDRFLIKCCIYNRCFVYKRANDFSEQPKGRRERTEKSEKHHQLHLWIAVKWNSKIYPRTRSGEEEELKEQIHQQAQTIRKKFHQLNQNRAILPTLLSSSFSLNWVQKRKEQNSCSRKQR